MSSNIIAEDFSYGKEYIVLMDMYDKYIVHHKIYEKAAKENNTELFNEKHHDLFVTLYNMVEHIDSNRDILQQFRQDTFFKQVEDLLYDAKNKMIHSDTILKFRKCLIWMRKKY